MQLQEDIYTDGGVQTHTLANIIKISINEKNSINYCITWTLH